MAEASQYKAELRTLGPGNLQASPGDHKHDGTTSKRIDDPCILLSMGSTNASIQHQTWSTLSWNTIELEFGKWSLSNGIVTVPETAWYDVRYNTTWANDGLGGNRACLFLLNGGNHTPLYSETHGHGTQAISQQVAGYVLLTKGNTVGLQVWQSTGVGLVTGPLGAYTRMSIRKTGL